MQKLDSDLYGLDHGLDYGLEYELYTRLVFKLLAMVACQASDWGHLVLGWGGQHGRAHKIQREIDIRFLNFG